MIKIPCIVIDDEPNAIKLMESHIEKVPFLDLQASFYDGIEGLNYMTKNPVDLVFLDINLPVLSGTELAAILPNHQKIIFTTAYPNYALQSYEYDALDYIQKPISFQRFLKAATKAEIYFNSIQKTDKAKRPNQREYIFIRYEKQFVRIDFKDILFFESQKEYISIHSSKKKYIFYKRMKDLQTELPSNFVRVHHSFIINLDYVSHVDTNTVMIEQSEIPVGETFKEKFLTIVRRQTL